MRTYLGQQKTDHDRQLAGGRALLLASAATRLQGQKGKVVSKVERFALFTPRMRAFVRVLPALVAAAMLGGCAAKSKQVTTASAVPAPATDAPPTQLPVKTAVQAPVSAPSVAHVRPVFRKHHAHPEMLASRPQSPQCDLSKAPENIGANQEQIAIVDYERQCYKELEAIQRAKLDALEAGARRGHRAADHAVAKREPPSCQMSSAPAGASASDAKLAALEYERQCYKKVVEFQRTELDALQSHAATKRPAAQRVTRPLSNSLMTAPASGN